MTKPVVQEPEGQADGDEEPLHHGGQQEQCHGDPDEGVDDAEGLALGRQGRLVAVTCSMELFSSRR